MSHLLLETVADFLLFLAFIAPVAFAWAVIKFADRVFSEDQARKGKK